VTNWRHALDTVQLLTVTINTCHLICEFLIFLMNGSKKKILFHDSVYLLDLINHFICLGTLKLALKSVCKYNIDSVRYHWQRPLRGQIDNVTITSFNSFSDRHMYFPHVILQISHCTESQKLFFCHFNTHNFEKCVKQKFLILMRSTSYIVYYFF